MMLVLNGIVLINEHDGHNCRGLSGSVHEGKMERPLGVAKNFRSFANVVIAVNVLGQRWKVDVS